MNSLKRIVALFTAFVLTVVMIPFSAINAHAIGEVLSGRHYTYAGQTTTYTCQGGTNYMQTHVIFSGSGIGKLTKYESDNSISYENEFCGDLSYTKTSCLKGEYFVIEVYYGSIELYYTTSNTLGPIVETVDNGKKIDPAIKTNISEVYLTVGDKAELDISWVFPGYYAELANDYYKNNYYNASAYTSKDSGVANVDSDGVITAEGVGETSISMAYRFGYSKSKYITLTAECTVHVLADYGIKEAYDKYYANGNDKYFNIVVLDDEEEKTTGFNIQVGETIYNTGADNQMMITFPDDYSGDVIVSKEGFISYTLEDKYLSAYNWITLYRENDGMPVIQAVLGHSESDPEWHNLKVHSLNVYEKSADKYEIDIKVFWGEKKEHPKRAAWLQQGNITVPLESGTTNLVALGKYFKNNGLPIYACVQTADGIKIKTQILVNLYSPDEYFSLDFGDEGGLTAELTGDVDAVKNHQFNFKLSGSVPLKFSIGPDGKIKGSIGVKATPYENNYTYYDDIKKTVQRISEMGKDSASKNSKEVDKLIEKIKKDGGDVDTAKRNFGVTCDVSFIGYFEGYLVNGDIDLSELGIVCSVSADAKYTQQSLAFSVPFYWQVSIKAEIESSLTAFEKNEQGELKIKIPDVEFKFSISGTLALGFDKIAGAGVRATGELSILLPEDAEAATDSTWTISLKFCVLAQVVGMEFTQSFWEDIFDWQIYPYEEPNQKKLLTALSNEAFYTQAPRTYLLQPSAFGERAIESDDNNHLTIETIGSNIYTDSKPQIVELDDKLLLVWIGDKSDRSDENRTCLYYSVYNKNEGTWSKAKELFDDGKADFNPILKKVQGKVCLVWQKASAILNDGATLTDIAKSLDIYYSEFDNSSDLFSSPVNVSGDNQIYDSSPAIASVDGKITLVWTQNSDNNIFESSGSNSILSATLENGRWNTTLLASNLKTINGLAACENDNVLTVYFAADTDEEYSTSDDIEIFMIKNGAVSQITDNNVIDSMPQVDNNQLFWYSNGKIATETEEIDYLSDEAKYSVVSSEDGNTQAVLYTVCSGMTNNIFATINDGNGWGNPIQITDFKDSYITDFSGYFDDGALSVVVNLRSVSEDYKLGTAFIKKCTKSLFSDLSVDAAEYQDYSLVKDGVLRGNAVISNNGTTSTKTFSVSVSDKNGKVLSTNDFSRPLLPGETREIQFYCRVADITENEVYISVTSPSLNEENIENNKIKLVINKFDVSVENAFAEIDSKGETTITAFVVNRGLLPLSNIEVSFYKDNLKGSKIGSVLVDTLEVSSSKLITFKTAAVQANSVVYVYATELDQENIKSNNYDFAYAYPAASKSGTIIETPKSITDGNMELDYEYYISTKDKSERYIVNFVAPDDGYYKFSFLQYDIEDYPRIRNTIDIIENSQKIELVDYYTEEEPNGNKKISIGNYIYRLKADEEYAFTIESEANQTTEIVISKAPLPTDIIISDRELDFSEGDLGARLRVTMNPVHTYGDCVWQSSNEAAAIVSEDGYVKPVGGGDAQISVTVNGTSLKATCTVSVQGAEKEKLEPDIPYGDLQVGFYYIQVPQSGYYTFIFNECQMDLYDSQYNSMGSTYSYNNMYYNMICRYLESEEKYNIKISSSSDEINGVIQSCNAPINVTLSKEIELSQNTDKRIIIYTEKDDTYFDSVSSRFSVSNPEIAEITQTASSGHITDWEQSYEAYFIIRGLKIGDTSLTIATKDGGIYEFPIHVSDAPLIHDGEEVNISLDENESVVYRFVPEDTAFYTFSACGTDGCKIQVLDQDNSTYLAGMGQNYQEADHYVSVQYKFEKEKTYYLKFEGNYFNSGDYKIQINRTVNATELILSDDNISGYIGEKHNLKYNLLPKYSFDETIDWKSSRKDVADVCDGVVLFLQAGTAIITATSENGLTADCVVEVKEIPSIRESELITLTTDVDAGVGMFSFTPTEDGTYEFFSSNNSVDTYGYIYDMTMQEIASDDDSGGSGNFKITCFMTAGTTYYLKAKPYFDDAFGVYTIQIRKQHPAVSVQIIPDSDFEIYEGYAYLLTAKLYPENAISETYSWDSSNSSVAIIDDAGVLTPLSKGKTTITVTTENNLSDSIEITVREAPQLSNYEEKNGSIEPNVMGSVFKFIPQEDGVYAVHISNPEQYETMYSYVIDEDGNEIGSAYSDDGYAEYENKFLANKLYYICTSFMYDDVYGDYTISVEKLVDPVTIEIVDGEEITGYINDSYQLSVTLTPQNAIKTEITWSSTNDGVASVQNGCVYFHSSGTAIIKATLKNGFSDQISVTVQDFPEVHLGDVNTVEITSDIRERKYKFNPAETGAYSFTLGGGYMSIEIMDENGFYLTSSSTTFNYELTAGKTYFISVHCFVTGTYTFKIDKATSISNIEILSYPTRMQYYKGFVDPEYYGLKIRITFEDGTFSDWSYPDYTGVAGYQVSVTTHVKDENGTNEYIYTEISCGGKSIFFVVDILENPVEYIEVVNPDVASTLIENVDGYWSRYDGEEYFHYDYPDLSKLQLCIHYKDGTTKNANLFDSVDGYTFFYENDQREMHWKLGSDNYITISYLGASVSLPVTIAENPVASISIDKAPSREYVWGDTEYGYLYEGDYFFFPSDYTGLVFTICYADGSSKTFSYNDMVSYQYYDEIHWQLNGRDISFESSQSYSNPGQIPVTMTYMGKTAEYYVKLKETPVESIEVIEAPSKVEYTDWYHPILDGLQLKIHYNNGDYKIVALTNENIQYDVQYWSANSFCAYTVVDDYPLEINLSYDYYSEKAEYAVSYLGKECSLNCFAISKGQKIVSVDFENVSSNGDDMKLEIQYSDGSSETVELHPVATNEVSDGNIFGYALTENGVLEYAVTTIRDEAGAITKYEINIFNQVFVVLPKSVMVGDVDNDGSITNKDFTALRRYMLGGWDVSINSEAADIDGDGTITNKDATALRRFMLGGWGVELE